MADEQVEGSPRRGPQAGDDRDQTAEDRDQVSEKYEQAAEARDELAEDRDQRAEAREDAAPIVDPGARADRSAAWRDRRGGSIDRSHAAHDRKAASADRAASADERRASSLDALTGAHRREAGMVELSREIARALRTQQTYLLAFIDVDRLKETNDSLGHAAGDQLLRRVVTTMRAHLRSYDLIIRYGGDEFLCAMGDLGMAAAAQRFELIKNDLAAAPYASITIGLTELRPEDSIDDLIGRADTALRSERLRSHRARMA
jgi:diguanylate cyclase (GGDEF)-like protein